MVLSSFFMRRCVQGGAACFALAAACVLAPVQKAHAQLPVVTAQFTQGGGFFNYNFSVFNNTPATLADVNVAFPTNAVATNLSAPAGFQIVFDANGLGQNQGVVDFFTTDGTQDFFAGTTVSGFLLRTTANLNGAAFNALDVNGNEYNGTVVAVAAAAPEPGTLSILAFGGTPAAAALLRLRRRRKSASASLKG